MRITPFSNITMKLTCFWKVLGTWIWQFWYDILFEKGNLYLLTKSNFFLWDKLNTEHSLETIQSSVGPKYELLFAAHYVDYIMVRTFDLFKSFIFIWTLLWRFFSWVCNFCWKTNFESIRERKNFLRSEMT